MKQDEFKPHTRYTVTLRDPGGRLRPANIYVYRPYNGFMVARMMEGSGILRKIRYDEVLKIVKATEVPRQDRFFVPEAVLAERNWKDRESMRHYSTSPHSGK